MHVEMDAKGNIGKLKHVSETEIRLLQQDPENIVFFFMQEANTGEATW